MIETHRSIVNTPECDANEHLNVSGYVQRFSEAGQNLFAMLGKGALAYRPSNRHFRFHREMEAGAQAAVLSIRIGAGEYRKHILHVLQDLSRGGIAATCLDSGFAHPTKFVPRTGGGAPASAKPRSLAPAPFKPADTAGLVRNQLAIVAHRNRVTAAECDGTGRMTDQAMVARFFAAASHLWPHSGFRNAWFLENGYGGAALEMKLTIHQPATEGTDYEITSWVPAMKGKLLPLSNQMSAVPGGKPIASISAVSVVMDRKTRMAVDIPEAVSLRHAARFAGMEHLVTF